MVNGESSTFYNVYAMWMCIYRAANYFKTWKNNLFPFKSGTSGFVEMEYTNAMETYNSYLNYSFFFWSRQSTTMLKASCAYELHFCIIQFNKTFFRLTTSWNEWNIFLSLYLSMCVYITLHSNYNVVEAPVSQPTNQPTKPMGSFMVEMCGIPIWKFA